MRSCRAPKPATNFKRYRLSKAVIIGLAWVASIALCGCSSFGPGTVARDRFDYVTSLSESLKRQTLLNLVKTRYADAPVFLDVASVINAYSYEGEVALNAQSGPVGRSDQFLNLGGTGRYADHPTITYAPLTGDKFARDLMSPLPVEAVLAVLQSGYRADIILRVCLNSINGLDNAYGGYGNFRPGSEDFQELTTLLREAQVAGRIDLRVTPLPDKRAILFLRPAEGREEVELDRKIRGLLRLDPRVNEFDVVPGGFSSNPRQIAIQARSMLQVMTDFASYIDVPPFDVADGRVYSHTRTDDQLRMYPPPLRIRSAGAAPPDAYVAVRYREHWFWIDDREVHSKAVFNLLLLMFSLTQTAGQQAAPILTVPTR